MSKLSTYVVHVCIFTGILFDLLYFFEDLAANGLTLVESVPPEGLQQLVNSVGGFHKPTHYGVDFQVTQRLENLNNLAYSSKSLGLHLDLPFYKYKPGVMTDA